MKRIGILTFHRAHNYGAFLQCFSLVDKILSECKDVSVEVIDINSGVMDRYYSTKNMDMIFGSENIRNCNIRNMMSHAKQVMIKELHDIKYLSMKKKQAELFIKTLELLPLSKEAVVSDDANHFYDYINDLNYDVVIVGSDAIWNDRQTFSPNPYFLSPQIKAKKMSYAASSYGMPYRDLDCDYLNQIKDNLKDFQFIGVRDIETEKYMNYIDITGYHHTPDPSLYYPFPKMKTEKLEEELKEKLVNRGIDLNKDVYAIMGGNWLGKIARDLIGNDKQLVAIYAQNKYANAYIFDLTPIQWASIFGYFKMTFTSFFHGTIFSLQNGTPTFTIEEKSGYASQYTTKTKDLLTRLGLLDYYHTLNDGDIMDELRIQYRYLLDTPQQERIRIALEKERAHGKDFFENLNLILEN